MDNYRATRLTLIQRIQDQKDDVSWNEFVGVYRNYLYVVIRNMNISHHDAEELVQSTLLKIWEKLPSFQYQPDKGRFRSWICTIARNQVIDFCRSEKSHQKTLEKARNDPSSMLKSFDETELSDIESMAEKEWENYIANLALEAARKKFAEKTINCFLLDMKGLSPSEIASQLDIVENSVYVYRTRVQNFILKQVKTFEEEYG